MMNRTEFEAIERMKDAMDSMERDEAGALKGAELLAFLGTQLGMIDTTDFGPNALHHQTS